MQNSMAANQMSNRITNRCVPVVAGVLITLLVAASPARADQDLAKSVDFIRNLADRAITTLTVKDISPQARRAQFRELFHNAFAVKGIAQFVLGRYWRSASAAQRKEFQSLFEDVIVKSWAGRFAQYSGQKFQVKDAVAAPSAHPSEHAVIVHSIFYTDPQTPVRIDWRVANKDNLFQITDVLIEGISMAHTRRDEYTSIIHKEHGQLSGLFDQLRKKRKSEG